YPNATSGDMSTPFVGPLSSRFKVLHAAAEYLSLTAIRYSEGRFADKNSRSESTFTPRKEFIADEQVKLQ
ncbi:MAG: hypothetical protein KJ060_13955, partial [Candidatus Hydrogenedentes bacterium]|nr:hypothetical protein [Candidatus Hydrogenedentota bacterium]